MNCTGDFVAFSYPHNVSETQHVVLQYVLRAQDIVFDGMMEGSEMITLSRVIFVPKIPSNQEGVWLQVILDYRREAATGFIQ